ncbi:hypothetical protein ACFY2M_38370 [Streptomyces sp. NPDC001276]|uniref:hypothetical protein n=1 Tax=Streptomyces sp. NPDC001276 TaxID=3364555 RepID=UPI00368249D0
MDVDDLTTALASHTPDPEAVLAALQTKRRKRARRRILAAGGAAVVAAGVITLWSAGSGTPTAPPAAADGCAVMPLQEDFAVAREEGFSVVLAKGVLTGRSASPAGPVYAEMRLSDVRTLSGPEIRSGSTVWLRSDASSSGPGTGASSGSLWARDGSLLGVITPQVDDGGPKGSVMRVAPVVDGQVVLSTAGCWLEDRPTHAFPRPLAEIPESDSYRRAAEMGFQTVPLSEVERFASH